ncbi:MAG: RlmE family RNA methyltransferase [Deltaproteobacteria bacterium]|nr:RlmE family RNA methyltransferase [Deltaproteobacteria bacterium]
MARRRRAGSAKRQTEDHFTRKARREGFPARSVYKLQEIERKARLFRGGMKVLDLGASPGSWTLFAAKQVGPSGRVLSLDLKSPKTALPAHVEWRVGDAFTQPVEELGAPRSFDIVLSDMAPSTTGRRDLDQYRSFALFMRALELADSVLAPGGAFVGKLFQGSDFEQARQELRDRFEKVRVVQPPATRAESYEIFLVGQGYGCVDKP